jgi:V8-like Glu-specific endopeptidase
MEGEVGRRQTHKSYGGHWYQTTQRHITQINCKGINSQIATFPSQTGQSVLLSNQIYRRQRQIIQIIWRGLQGKREELQPQ